MTPTGEGRSALARLRASARVCGLRWTATLLADRVFPWGLLRLWPPTVVSPEALDRQLRTICAAWGMPPDHAAITVEHLLYADLRGIDSHGSSLMLGYHRSWREGSVTMTPEIATIREGETTALVDGGGGLGHVPGERAMELAIAKSRATGVGAVAVRNSGHYGAAGVYASMAAREGLIGFATTSTRRPSVVPTFGREAKLGTNPIAIAAPATRHPPFLLDVATSTASLGAMLAAWRRGRPIPRGWAITATGAAIRNGRRAAQARRLTPLGSRSEMGSHKGYGLGAAMEVLASVLPGARPATNPGGVGHFFVAIDPRRFRDEGSFEADLDRLIDDLHDSAPADETRPVLVPGDPEREALEERSRQGIPLPRVVVEDLRVVAAESGARFLLDDAP